MTAPVAFKYRAFLSYSHRDKVWGDWLHPALERYQIPRDLKLKPGRFGAVPGNLRPIFRDRADLGAGHSLNKQVDAALSASEALVVMCSPDSATSPYVNEEIRRFKALGRGDRIFPIIVRGRPGGQQDECFPQALRRLVNAQGDLTESFDEPIAADARDEGDGRDLAKLKIAAGLLGVELDELRKREAIETKRRQRRTALLAGFMTMMAIVATFSAVYAFQQRNAALEAKRLEAVAKNDALAARDLAEEKRKEAELRYEQALNSTLRLVTTAATLRTVIEKTSFGINQIEGKGESDDFLVFLRDAPDQNVVWFRLSQVLMSYEDNLPAELRHYRSQLINGGLPLQWVKHAELIMTNVVRRGDNKPEYKALLEQIRARIVTLGSTPSKDCVDSGTIAVDPNLPTRLPTPPSPDQLHTQLQVQQMPLDTQMMQQPLPVPALPPC